MKRSVLFLALLALFLLSGCVGSSIRQDAYSENLPVINPRAGVEREMTSVLYFRLQGEPYLVPVTKSFYVKSNEYAAEAILRELIKGPKNSVKLDDVLPEGTRVINVKMEGSVLYVVFSKEVFGTGKWDELSKRLSAYAVVNSLCELDDVSRVQIQVASDSTGLGASVVRFQFGLPSEGGSAQYLEPLSKDMQTVITRKRMVELILAHIEKEEYIQAYPLLFQHVSASDAKLKDSQIAKNLSSIGALYSYNVKSIQLLTEEVDSQAIVDMTFINSKTGEEHYIANAVLDIYYEDDLYKVSYSSFLNAYEAAS